MASRLRPHTYVLSPFTPHSHPLLTPTPTPHSPPPPPHPSRFLSLTVSTAKRAPELIQLLEMHSYLAPLQKGKVCVCVCVCNHDTDYILPWSSHPPVVVCVPCHGHPTPLWSCVSPAMVIHPPVVMCVPCHGHPTPLWSCVSPAMVAPPPPSVVVCVPCVSLAAGRSIDRSTSDEGRRRDPDRHPFHRVKHCKILRME